MANFLNFASAKGLAYRNNWQADIENAFRNEQLDHAAIREKEQNIQYMAEVMKAGKAPDNYNNAMLEGYVENLNKELAEFVSKNPDFRSNINKMNKFNQISSKYTNNEYIRNGLQVQRQFELFQEDLLRNPDDWDETTTTNEMNKYLSYVNQKPGEEVAEPYTFVPPSRYSVNDIVTEVGKNLMAKTIPVTTMKNGIEYIESTLAINPEDLDATVMSAMAEPKFRNKIISGWENTKNETGESMYRSPEEFFGAMLMASKQTGVIKGEYDAWKLARAKEGLTNSGNTVMPIDYFGQEVLNPLTKYGKVKNPNLAPLTSAGKIGKTLEQDFNGNTKLYFVGHNESGEQIITSEEYAGEVTLLETKEVFKDPTKRNFVKAYVEIKNPSDDMIDKLTKQGFKKIGSSQPATQSTETDKFNLQFLLGNQDDDVVYRGTVATDLIVNSQTMNEYQRSVSATKNDDLISRINDYRMQTDDIDIRDKTVSQKLADLNNKTGGDWGLATDVDLTYWESIYPDGEFLSDKKTGSLMVYNNGKYFKLR